MEKRRLVLIDSHAHLSSQELLPQANTLVLRAQEAGVQKVVNICTDLPSLEGGISLAQRFPGVVYNVAATPPHDVDGDDFFPRVEEAIEQGALVGIGESGLDYFYERAPRELQRDCLFRYAQLAQKHSLPFVVHCREAFPDLFAVLKEFSSLPVLIHCFTGDLEEARQVVDRGWYCSLSGIVTFKKSDSLRAVAKFLPLDRLMIETDSPYLAPQGHRGKPNEPAFVSSVAHAIAEVRGESVEEIASHSTDNARKFFLLN